MGRDVKASWGDVEVAGERAAAGAAIGAAVCSATGVGVVISPLCAVVGGAIGAATKLVPMVWDALAGWFGADEIKPNLIKSTPPTESEALAAYGSMPDALRVAQFQIGVFENNLVKNLLQMAAGMGMEPMPTAATIRKSLALIQGIGYGRWEVQGAGFRPFSYVDEWNRITAGATPGDRAYGASILYPLAQQWPANAKWAADELVATWTRYMNAKEIDRGVTPIRIDLGTSGVGGSSPRTTFTRSPSPGAAAAPVKAPWGTGPGAPARRAQTLAAWSYPARFA